MTQPETPPWVNADGSIDHAKVQEALDAASAECARQATERDARHAAFHGRPRVRSIRVGARPGYRGEVRCGDCYHGTPWTDAPVTRPDARSGSKPSAPVSRRGPDESSQVSTRSRLPEQAADGERVLYPPTVSLAD